MKDIPRHIIGGIVMLIAVGIIGMLFVRPIPAENQDVALVLLGIALGWAGTVVQFHFGSSQGSKNKADHIERLGGE